MDAAAIASVGDAGCSESIGITAGGTLKTRGNKDNESSRRMDMRGFRPRVDEWMNARGCVGRRTSHHLVYLFPHTFSCYFLQQRCLFRQRDRVSWIPI